MSFDRNNPSSVPESILASVKRFSVSTTLENGKLTFELPVNHIQATQFISFLESALDTTELTYETKIIKDFPRDKISLNEAETNYLIQLTKAPEISPPIQVKPDPEILKVLAAKRGEYQVRTMMGAILGSLLKNEKGVITLADVSAKKNLINIGMERLGLNLKVGDPDYANALAKYLESHGIQCKIKDIDVSNAYGTYKKEIVISGYAGYKDAKKLMELCSLNPKSLMDLPATSDTRLSLIALLDHIAASAPPKIKEFAEEYIANLTKYPDIELRKTFKLSLNNVARTDLESITAITKFFIDKMPPHNKPAPTEPSQVNAGKLGQVAEKVFMERVNELKESEAEIKAQEIQKRPPR